MKSAHRVALSREHVVARVDLESGVITLRIDAFPCPGPVAASETFVYVGAVRDGDATSRGTRAGFVVHRPLDTVQDALRGLFFSAD